MEKSDTIVNPISAVEVRMGFAGCCSRAGQKYVNADGTVDQDRWQVCIAPPCPCPCHQDGQNVLC